MKQYSLQEAGNNFHMVEFCSFGTKGGAAHYENHAEY